MTNNYTKYREKDRRKREEANYKHISHYFNLLFNNLKRCQYEETKENVKKRE